jgi:hypothetical protein
MTYLPHMWSTYRMSANSLYECYPPPTSSTQVSDGKALIPFWIKEMSLDCILVIIKAHTLLITLCICSTLYYKTQLQESHLSQLILHSTHSNSLNTLIDAKKIIQWCSLLPTLTCKPRRLDVKNRIHCLSRQNTLLKYKSLAFILHASWDTWHIIVHLPHNVLKYNCYNMNDNMCFFSHTTLL